MADDTDQSEKTEEPTQKRLEDAWKKGDVAKSQEVSSWFVILGTALVFAIAAQTAAGNLGHGLKGFLEHADQFSIDGGALRSIWMESGTLLIASIGIPVALLALAALAGNLVQHRMVWSLDPIKPKWSKISPLSGFKRLFSKQSLVNFVKGLMKLAVVALVMMAILIPERDRLDTIVLLDPSGLLPLARDLALKLIGGVLAVMTVVAGLDLLWQRHQWHEKQKMTLREVKDEYKQQEGDPAIKAKLRQIRMERSRRRMMANVPEATVVLTNPTHYSVALKYEPGMNAPICLAKGVDDVAMKIREIARANDVPIIENPPLTRALYGTVEIDGEIPEAHYRAVAEVIGYILHRDQQPGWKPG